MMTDLVHKHMSDQFAERYRAVVRPFIKDRAAEENDTIRLG